MLWSLLIVLLSLVLSVSSVRATPAQSLDNPLARYQYARTLADHGHILACRRLLLPMCHRANTTAEMYCLLVRTYLEDPEQDPKMNRKIEQDLRLAAQLNPDLGSSYRFMAEYYNLLGRYDDALKNEDLALNAKIPDLGALKQKVITCSNLGRYQDALDNINQCIVKVGPSDHYYTVKGNVLQEMKRYDEAVAAYRLALKMRNQDRTVLQLARCLDLAGKYQEGIDEMTKLLKTNSKDGDALAMRARLQVKNKHPELALADLSKAIELEPSRKLYTERAALYNLLGRKPEAVKDMAKVKEFESEPF